MVSFPPRKQLLRLSLLLIGINCCAIGVGGVTDPQAPNTYSLEKADSATYNFTDLPADAQRVVEDGSDTPTPAVEDIPDEDTPTSVAVEDIPDEFSPTRVTLVRYEGTLFCIQVDEGRESTQAPEAMPSADQTVTVRDCAGVVFEFDSLSPQGKAVVSGTLDSSNNRTHLSQEVPPEFSADIGDAWATQAEGEIPPGNGIYYIIKDGTVYQFTIRGGGIVIGDFFGGLLVFVAGLVLVVFGLLSYNYTRIRIAALIGAGVSVVIVPAWFQFVGLHGWSIWLNQQPKHLTAIVLLVLTGLSITLYDKHQGNEKA